LIILTYILVTLHYYNCRLAVCLWRPFLRYCIRFQRQCDIRNSLVDVFATFLLLSYVKFLSVSFDILTPSFMWNMTWTRQPTVLYYDGSVEYFSKEHLPYAILAIIVLLVFTIIPIALLCLYSLPLLSDALEYLSLEISTTSHIYGHLPRLLQGWHQWNKGLSIFRCCLSDHSSGSSPVIGIHTCFI